MKNLTKIVKNSTISANKYEVELTEFLRNYRATPHASTKKTPNELMFRTESSTSKMLVNRSIQRLCEAVSNDFKAKERMKAISDHKFKATNSSLRVGDRVYLRNANQTGKSATVYDPNPYTVQRLAGTQAVNANDTYSEVNIQKKSSGERDHLRASR